LSAANVVATIYSDWMLHEAYFGDCAQVTALYGRMQQALAPVSGAADVATITRMGLGSLQGQTRCPLPSP
jgi:hypothetical protein